MHFHRLKLRFRRDFRRRKKQAEKISLQAEDQFERNFIRRLGRLLAVKRFVASWILLLVLLGGILVVQTRALGGYYQSLQPAPGGRYAEGIVGNYTNINPLYATGQADNALAHLIFAGLFKYNDKNQLVGDLADRWSVDSAGTTYTVHLRPNLTWQDGKPLTAQDVIFTYQTIQNPDAQSPLNGSWTNVGVSATNPQTVVFTLPNPLASFPYSLTNGIIPQHILGSVPMDQMRSIAFNTTQPVGAGPFSLKTIQITGDTPTTREQQVELQPFARYHSGEPKLGSLVVHTFPDQKSMLHGFEDQNINAMVGLSSLPANLAKDGSVQQYNMPLTAATMVFFKTTSGVLADATVRQALVQGADVPDILHKLGYPATPVREPLLASQVGFNASYQQSGTNLAAARQALTADGWKPGAGGIRSKGGQPLSFTLYAQDNSEYAMVTSTLKQQWRKLGVDLHVALQQDEDFQATVAYHNYDALLYGISIGVDPDVFVYWDSSQADVRSQSRLNFSEYSSATADAALEAGRTRTDASLRSIKYQPFLQAWQKDAPALGLYQPRFLYVTRGQVFGLNEHTLNTDTGRYDNVQNWMIRERRQTTGN